MSRLSITNVADGVYVVRFLVNESDGSDPFAPFDGVCTVVIDNDKAMVYGMCGSVSRRHLRDGRNWLVEQGVNTLLSHRAPGHVLPGGIRNGEWTEVDLKTLRGRL